MSHSSISFNENNRILFPAMSNVELGSLINTLNTDLDLVENEDNRSKLVHLVRTLTVLGNTPPSSERTLKIHTEVMKLYLLDGCVEQGEAKKEGLARYLENAMTKFFQDKKLIYFTGNLSTTAKKKKADPTNLIHTIFHPVQIEYIVNECYKRVRQAFINWAVNTNDKAHAKEAERIYENAKRVVVELESANAISSRLWNGLLARDGLNVNTPFAIPLVADGFNATENREKSSVKKMFDRNIKNVTAAVNQTFYPAQLVYLLEHPKNLMDRVEDAKLKQLINEIKRIQLSFYPNIGMYKNQIQAEIYKACMVVYQDAYIHESQKSGHQLTKGTLLTHLEKTFQTFQERTNMDMFVGVGAKEHERILNSQKIREATPKQVGDTLEMRAAKTALLQELVKNAFDSAMKEGILGTSKKSADHFIYAYKSIIKMGPEAIQLFNQHAAPIIQAMQVVAMTEPNYSPKDLKKIEEQNAKIQKKFPGYIAISEGADIRSVDLLKLFNHARSAPKLMEALYSAYPDNAPQYVAKFVETELKRTPDQIRFAKELVAKVKEAEHEPSQVSKSSSVSSQLHNVFTKPASTATTLKNSLASTVDNSRRNSVDRAEVDDEKKYEDKYEGELNIPKAVVIPSVEKQNPYLKKSPNLAEIMNKSRTTMGFAPRDKRESKEDEVRPRPPKSHKI